MGSGQERNGTEGTERDGDGDGDGDRAQFFVCKRSCSSQRRQKNNLLRGERSSQTAVVLQIKCILINQDSHELSGKDQDQTHIDINRPWRGWNWPWKWLIWKLSGEKMWTLACEISFCILIFWKNVLLHWQQCPPDRPIGSCCWCESKRGKGYIYICVCDYHPYLACLSVCHSLASSHVTIVKRTQKVS